MEYSKDSSVIKAGPKPISIGASVTATQVSRTFAIPKRTRLRVVVITSSVTASSGVTAKLQTSLGVDASGNVLWEDAKTVSLTTNASPAGWAIRLNPEDGTDLSKIPLGPEGRVVVTTGSGDAVAITDILVSQDP